jgi:glycosyltransferase involved in cell wall biosynthesis
MNNQPVRSPSTITVIVCTRNRPRLLENCLSALAQQTHADFDILVVDNAPIPQVRDVCRHHGARYVHEPVAGISRARNTGVRASRSDIVAFIDDDAIPDANWLELLAPVFRDPSIGAATGGTRYMKSYGNDRLMSAEIAQEPARPGRIFSRHDKRWFASASFGGIGDGMNMAFRRSLFARHVHFDERLGRGRLLEGSDEHVAFLSVLSTGFRIAHIPTAVVRHPAPAEPCVVAAQRVALLRSAIAYLFFLWFEFPEHRADLLGFVLRAIRKRLNAREPGTTASETMPRWQALQAAIAGASVYVNARREWKNHGTITVGPQKTGVTEPAHRRAVVKEAVPASLRLRV